jgi:hypothetical protein
MKFYLIPVFEAVKIMSLRFDAVQLAIASKAIANRRFVFVGKNQATVACSQRLHLAARKTRYAERAGRRLLRLFKVKWKVRAQYSEPVLRGQSEQGG